MCPPFSTTAIIKVIGSNACPAPKGIDATLNLPDPPLQPNCVEVSLTITYDPLLDPTIPHNVTGTDCCGIPFDLDLYVPSAGVEAAPVVLCVDLNQPWTIDPLIEVKSAGNCDCDPVPPFDCFCITVSAVGGDGSITGNYCDGTPFDLVILGGVNYEPICVRADGAWTKSGTIVPLVLGDCDEDKPCVPDAVCIEVVFTNNSSDIAEVVSFTLCNDLDRNIDLTTGQVSPPICIIAGSIVVPVSGNVTWVQTGVCS